MVAGTEALAAVAVAAGGTVDPKENVDGAVSPTVGAAADGGAAAAVAGAVVPKEKVDGGAVAPVAGAAGAALPKVKAPVVGAATEDANPVAGVGVGVGVEPKLKPDCAVVAVGAGAEAVVARGAKEGVVLKLKPVGAAEPGAFELTVVLIASALVAAEGAVGAAEDPNEKPPVMKKGKVSPHIK